MDIFNKKTWDYSDKSNFEPENRWLFRIARPFSLLAKIRESSLKVRNVDRFTCDDCSKAARTHRRGIRDSSCDSLDGY